MRKLYFLAFALLITATSFGQAILLLEDFSGSPQYALSTPEVLTSTTQYFTRTDGTGINDPIMFTDMEAYFAVQNLASPPQTMLFDDVNISTFTNLTFGVGLAHGAGNNWGVNDFVHFEYLIDNTGTWKNLVWVENDGTTSSAPQIDTDFNGTGNGMVLIDEFDEDALFTFSETGGVIDIRVTFSGLDAVGKDIAIDVIYLVNDFNLFPTATITSPTDGQSFAVGTTSVDVVYTTTNSPTSVEVYVNGVTTTGNVNGATHNITTVDGQTYYVEVIAFLGTIEVSGDFISFTVDTPLVFNEILADPGPDTSGLGNGDANGDGVRNGTEDEFIEIYNTSSSSVNMENYFIEDGFGVRHVFPGGGLSIVPGNSFITVFGGGTPTGISGVVQTATSGALGLNNTGDTVTLKNTSGNIVLQYTYGSEGGNDHSIARNPDFVGSFVEYTSIGGNTGNFSPGTINDESLLSTKDSQIEGFSFYPNPTSLGYVNISSKNGEIVKATVFDILGKQVIDSTVINSKLDVSNLSPGLYIMRLTQDNATVTKKLVIQ